MRNPQQLTQRRGKHTRMTRAGASPPEEEKDDLTEEKHIPDSPETRHVSFPPETRHIKGPSCTKRGRRS